MSAAWVVDASTAASLLVNDPLSAAAEAFIRRELTERRAALWAPDIMVVECANVLWKHVRSFGLAPWDARERLADLLDLDIALVAIDELLPRALDLAIELDLAVYDACYAALAEGLNAALVTADTRLAQRMADVGLPVERLA